MSVKYIAFFAALLFISMLVLAGDKDRVFLVAESKEDAKAIGLVAADILQTISEEYPAGVPVAFVSRVSDIEGVSKLREARPWIIVCIHIARRGRSEYGIEVNLLHSSDRSVMYNYDIVATGSGEFTIRGRKVLGAG